MRVHDVARIELGSQDYSVSGRFNGKPSAIVAVYQLPGSNAVNAAAGVSKLIGEMKQRFPADMDFATALDTTKAVTEGMKEIVVTLLIALALVMALWVNDRIAGRAAVRMAYFTPTVLPMIAVANIWLFFYTPQYGLLEQVLALFGAPAHNWLGTPSTALACVTAVAVWKEAGFFMIFYLAALQQIPPVLAEASALEGASRLTFFRRVQFPLLMPTTLFVLINAVINAFRTVDHIIVMTRGGPDNATTLLLYYIYQVGFTFWDSTYAATLTIVLLGGLAAAALGQYVFLERRVHYR